MQVFSFKLSAEQREKIYDAVKLSTGMHKAAFVNKMKAHCSGFNLQSWDTLADLSKGCESSRVVRWTPPPVVLRSEDFLNSDLSYPNYAALAHFIFNLDWYFSRNKMATKQLSDLVSFTAMWMNQQSKIGARRERTRLWRLLYTGYKKISGFWPLLRRKKKINVFRGSLCRYIELVS